MASPAQAFDIKEPKICERCAKTFYRIVTPLRKLRDGSIIDPSKLCPSCENHLARGAHHTPVVKQEIEPEIKPRTYSLREIARMHNECLRKEAFFSPSLAQKVAKRSRKRHQGSNPNQFYKCRTVIDPVEYPDRARPHWHLGGRSDRKF